jgi:hypothetical protein
MHGLASALWLLDWYERNPMRRLITGAESDWLKRQADRAMTDDELGATPSGAGALSVGFVHANSMITARCRQADKPLIIWSLTRSCSSTGYFFQFSRSSCSDE